MNLYINKVVAAFRVTRLYSIDPTVVKHPVLSNEGLKRIEGTTADQKKLREPLSKMDVISANFADVIAPSPLIR